MDQRKNEMIGELNSVIESYNILELKYLFLIILQNEQIGTFGKAHQFIEKTRKDRAQGLSCDQHRVHHNELPKGSQQFGRKNDR